MRKLLTLLAAAAGVTALAAPAQAAVYPASTTWCVYTVNQSSVAVRTAPRATAEKLYSVHEGDHVSAQQNTTYDPVSQRYFRYGSVAGSGYPQGWMWTGGLTLSGACSS